jgi:adenylate kinase
MINVIMMGPPGAGKGTQAKLLTQAFKIPHISTGDMFREAIKAETELGLLAQTFIQKGDLVPDDVTIKLVKERLSQKDCKRGYLLDGFPRTLPQAEALEVMTKELGAPINAVINLNAETNELVRRISGRRVCRGCGAPYHIDTLRPKVAGVCDICGGELYQRKDDTVTALQTRLQHYLEDTKPLEDFYRKRGLLFDLDGLTPKEQLFAEISAIFKKVDAA